MSFENNKFIKVIDRDGLRKLVISNPRKKNALSSVAYQEITEVLNDAATNDSIVVTVITGEGDFYSSGNDISAALQSGGDIEENIRLSLVILEKMIRAFFTHPKLLVSVVNGPCIGIAATTAVLCDVIYATDNAYFYTPFSQLGLCAEGCGSYTFPRILGKAKATEMLLLNYKLPAEEALRFNFVSEVFKQSDLEAVLWPRIRQFAKLPKESLKASKKLMQKFETADLEKACIEELKELHQRLIGEEFMEAAMNFMQRRSKL